MRKLKVYIAGPITDTPDFEDTFNSAAYLWREAGWDVINPVELDHHDQKHSWVGYMRRDIPYLVDCDAIALLPGWQDSPGATLEHQIACALLLKVYDAKHPAQHPVMHEYKHGHECCLIPNYWHIEQVLAERPA